jgi:ribosomal-protein-alanine N-acetyltransferase
MLKGKVITLRPVQEEDLPVLYEHSLDLDNRGAFWPLFIQTMTELRKEFGEHGFWSQNRGLLVLVENASGKVIGQISYFPTVPYLDELEIGYINYDTSQRRKGAMTEALTLLTRYLFDLKHINRIRLCIDTENKASRRVAEKGGYKHEGTQRGAMYHRGQHRDMELYAVLRSDVPAAPGG